MFHRRNTLQTLEYLALGILSRILNNTIVFYVIPMCEAAGMSGHTYTHTYTHRRVKADGVRKQASGERSPSLHRRPRTRSKGMGKRKKSRAKVTGSLWPTRALFVCVFLRIVAVMGSSEGWHVLSVASCDDGLRLLAGNSLCIALPRVGVCSNWNYRRVSWITAAFLLCCGDVEPNPGPNYKYPCTVCSYPMKCNQCGIQCSWCDKWTHAKCCGGH